MATTKPRISLTLEPANFEILRRLSVLQGRPCSAVLSDFLSVAWPVLASVADALDQAALIEKSRLSGFADALSAAEAKAGPVLQELQSLLSNLGGFPAEGGGVQGGANLGQPPGSNHGGQLPLSTHLFHDVKNEQGA